MNRTTLNHFQCCVILFVAPICLTALSGCATFFATYSEEYSEYPYDEEIQETTTEADSDLHAQADVPTEEPVRRLLQPLNKPDFEIADSPFESIVAEDQEPIEDLQEPSEPTPNPFAAMDQSWSPEIAQKTPTALKPAASSTAATFSTAEPRMPTPQENCQACEVTVAASPLVQAYPDEYIFDGGDRDHPVHYFGGSLAGLDTEDTVAEFKDHDGENHVTASNRVAVYAPRFGAVRTIAGPGVDIKVDKAAGATDISGFDSLNERHGLDTAVVNTPASGIATRRSASGVDTAQPAYMSKKSEAAVLANKVDQGLEAKSSSGLGTLELSSMQEVNVHILEPATSARRTGFGQRAGTTQATNAYGTFRVQATVGMEKGGRKGELHLTKEASPLIAKAGDVITFKIHFRNIGDYNVNEVRIIDNLTPRLIYVEGSGQIKAPNDSGGGLSVVPNKEGSQVLEFRLDEPLQGGDSGTITFKARVL